MKPKDKLESFVRDCQRIIIKRKAERVLEAREKQLKNILNQERNQLP